MIALYNEILFRPLFNFLVFIYNILPWHDFGLAIIILTGIIRLVFFPLSVKSLVSQKSLNKLQPKIKELQEKFKNINFKTGMVGDALRIPLQRGIYASSSSNELLKEVPEKYNNILIVKKLTPT